MSLENNKQAEIESTTATNQVEEKPIQEQEEVKVVEEEPLPVVTPVPTIYVRNLNDKIKQEGKCSFFSLICTNCILQR